MDVDGRKIIDDLNNTLNQHVIEKEAGLDYSFSASYDLP